MVLCNRLVFLVLCNRSDNVFLQTFDYFIKHLPTKCWFHCVVIFYLVCIEFKFCEMFAALPYTYTCMFSTSINSNVLHNSTRFLAFHIPLILALQQLKIWEIRSLFQPVKWQIFCILTIKAYIGSAGAENISSCPDMFCKNFVNACNFIKSDSNAGVFL